MEKKLLPFLIAFSALSVSASAAFYSVFGLSHLFAGASTEVIIMAGALEFAKLVVASLLYQYWNVLNKWLRAYLMLAVFILMVITSGGIYGFLSGAFAETNTQSQFLDKQIEIQTAKQNVFVEKKEDLSLEKIQLNQTIADLRTSLSNPTSVSYYSEEAGQVITTTSSSTRRALQSELNTTITERDTISQQINAVTDSIAVYDVKILEQQIVNWFMLLIIFVFDPLAIAMVVAANMAFAQIKTFKPTEEKKEYKVYKKSEAPKEKIIIEKEIPVEKIIKKEIIKEVPVEKIIVKKSDIDLLKEEKKKKRGGIR
jgi:hypothetical protein